MMKAARIWNIVALIMCASVAALNASSGRGVSAVIALVGICALAVMLATKRKECFIVLCLGYAASFVVAIYGAWGHSGFAVSLLMSVIGSCLVPAITWFFWRSCWKDTSAHQVNAQR